MACVVTPLTPTAGIDVNHAITAVWFLVRGRQVAFASTAAPLAMSARIQPAVISRRG